MMLKYVSGSAIRTVAMTAIRPWKIDAQMNLPAHFPGDVDIIREYSYSIPIYDFP